MTILGSGIKGDSESGIFSFSSFPFASFHLHRCTKKKSMIANSQILFMINVGYENDKCLELLSFWRAVRLNNFNAPQFAPVNKCG